MNQHKNDLDKNYILQLFDKGMRDDFFKQVIRIFSTTDEFLKRFEFDLNIYFCIYNIHPMLKKQATMDKASVEAFKKYLDTKGADLS